MSEPTGPIVVYVPATGAGGGTDGIAPGSAIVGRPDPDGGNTVEVYYEGALHNPVNIKTLADRALHAAGRMDQEYPTTARCEVPRDSLLAVGTFDPVLVRVELTGPASRRAIAGWLGVDELDDAELEKGGW